MDIYKEQFNETIKQIKNLPKGQEFFLKEVSPFWIMLSRGEKLNYGKAFKKAVLDGLVMGVTFVGKANNNSSIYKRIK